MEVQKRQRLDTAERFQKHLERVVEMIQGCLASLPDDLPHMEGPDGSGDVPRTGSAASSGGCSSGQAPRMKTEPMDIEEAGASCMAAGQQDKNMPVPKRENTCDKDAAMCSIIDEIA